MAKNVAIGIQDFSDLIKKNYFYIDKTDFIREWWESGDSVTLITRPRRFGKTLNMSMVEQLFSIKYADNGNIFEGLSIWEHEDYRALQGTYPVISLSFANVKETDFKSASYRICQLLMKQYEQYAFLRKSDLLSDSEKSYFEQMASAMNALDAPLALYQLSDFLCRYYGKKVIILLDEYDTPMQEAYINGYWEELVSFTRSFFNSSFKTNPWLERAIMTGITAFANSEAVFYCECDLAGSQGGRAISSDVSKESIFSDLNNLEVVTTTSDKYALSFGFTETEVFAALEKYELGDQKEMVKSWYDGFIFGSQKDIYNPWSILNFLNKRKLGTYWANTSTNSLVGKLLREGIPSIKMSFEALLRGESIQTPIDEQIVYSQLTGNEAAVWSLLLASGYLKVLSYESYYKDISDDEIPKYELALTNLEVRLMFRNMISRWFADTGSDYNDFIKAMLASNKKAMNAYMNRVALQTFSYFDTGRLPSITEPERFYHGFVLGLIVELGKKYTITSNRESGFGRYDVMLEPKNPEEDDAIILEFKVLDADEESDLKDTVAAALKQIEEKHYDAYLIEKGIPEDHIRKYGFAFRGKEVLIG